MMARAMKDSGIEWIGKIPVEWNLFRLKDYYSFEKGKNAALYTQEYIGQHNGSYPVYSGQTENNGIMGLINTFDYDIDECLFTTTVGAKVMTPMVLSGRFSLSQNCLIMKKRKECNNRFVYYALFPLFDYAKSLIPVYMQPSLRVSDLNKYVIFSPAEKEQLRIADFLDRRCAEIDSVIAKTEKTIEEYKALKQSIITEAVTKGIRPNRPMKDSGVEWIGEIAEGFEVKKLKFLCQILDQYRSPITADQRNQDAEVLYDYYGASGAIDKIDGYTIDDHVMLIGEDGANLRMRNLPLMYEVNGKAWINNHAHILKPKEDVDFYYLFYALEALDINTYITGSAQPKLSQDNLRRIWVPIPSLNEQREIAAYLKEKIAKIDSLMITKQQFLSDMETYKKSVICEYVTGKKEVYS